MRGGHQERALAVAAATVAEAAVVEKKPRRSLPREIPARQRRPQENLAPQIECYTPTRHRVTAGWEGSSSQAVGMITRKQFSVLGQSSVVSPQSSARNVLRPWKAWSCF